jgi:nitroreductase
MDFRDVVRHRRMVRSFTDAPLDPAALDRIVDAARRGPSAGYSQGVEFVVVTDPALRAEVGTPPNRAPSGVPLFVAQAPAQIIVCASAEVYRERYRRPDKQRVRAGVDDAELWHVPYWHVDAGAALMLILLAAVAEGFAAGIVGVFGAAGQERLRSLLRIPASYEAVAIVAIGHEAADARRFTGSTRTLGRRPRDEVVHRDGW